MATIDLSDTNAYPRIKRVSITAAAQQITLPRDCTKITFGSPSALYWANEGADGDVFDVDITDYSFVPANNLLTINMEVGRQSNRVLLIGTQSGTGNLSIIVEKDR
jgi:hypothetical protein